MTAGERGNLARRGLTHRAVRAARVCAVCACFSRRLSCGDCVSPSWTRGVCRALTAPHAARGYVLTRPRGRTRLFGVGSIFQNVTAAGSVGRPPPRAGYRPLHTHHSRDNHKQPPPTCHCTCQRGRSHASCALDRGSETRSWARREGWAAAAWRCSRRRVRARCPCGERRCRRCRLCGESPLPGATPCIAMAEPERAARALLIFLVPQSILPAAQPL